MPIGGHGKDLLWGGTDDDRSQFESGDSAASKANAGVIEDFSHGDGDKIDFALIDGQLTFVGSAAFTAANQVRVTQSDGDTFVGVNLEGTSTAEMWIKLEGSHSLEADAFLL